MDTLLRVSLTDLTVTDEPFPEEWTFLGGRAPSAKIRLKEVDPTCDPLGPGNEVVLRVFERMPISEELRNMRAVG